MATEVVTVRCPHCGRTWTGHFDITKEPTEKTLTCKDCKEA